MRSAVAFVAVFAAGLVGVAALGLAQGSDLVYSLGAFPQTPGPAVKAGQRICQGPVRLPDGEAFDSVVLTLGTYQRPGPAVRVQVRDADSGRRVAGGALAGGYPDIARAPSHDIRVGRVQTSRPLEICLENEGRGPVSVYGQFGVASPSTSATLDGAPLPTDMAITLHGPERSLLALMPDMLERASLFRAGWVGPPVYVVLGALVLLLAPFLLARAVARSAAEDA